ncbi:MAG: HAD family phosphatase [Bacteroidota bacterium]
MIKNIIFDIGGVLLDIDYDRTFTGLSQVMGIDIRRRHIPAHIFKLILGYEKGEINTETFLWNLQKESANLTPQPDKLIKAWNAMLMGWNPKRLDFLAELKGNYSLYLLSNTNDLHLEWFRKDLKKNHGVSDFDTRFFVQTFYSHELRMRKPEYQIYEKVLHEAGIRAEETLFIDDNEENVEKARCTGMHAVCHSRKEEIIDRFQNYITELSK